MIQEKFWDKNFGPMGHPWGLWGQDLRRTWTNDLSDFIFWSYRVHLTILTQWHARHKPKIWKRLGHGVIYKTTTRSCNTCTKCKFEFLCHLWLFVNSSAITINHFTHAGMVRKMHLSEGFSHLKFFLYLLRKCNYWVIKLMFVTLKNL